MKTTNGDYYRFEPRVERLVGAMADLEPALALGLLRERGRPVLLDSAAGEPCAFSLLGFDPLPLEVPQSLLGLRGFVQRLRRSGGESPPFFGGGFLGALSYDLGVEGVELRLPRDPWGLPMIVGGLYVDFLVRDHRRAETWLVLGIEPGDGRPCWEERRAGILEQLGRVARVAPTNLNTGPERLWGSADFRAGVEAVRERIADGEIYQANLSQRMLADYAQDPIDLYMVLRRNHPGPYLGYLGEPGLALLSGSPELLLDFEPGELEPRRPGRALTRPIKGTLPRGATAEEDALLASQLLASEKDRAELTMIVDLERNDLGSVAVPGGVSVEAFPRLESFATVHHLMADVRAEVPPECDAIELLAALFPGGSITGAPKLRSMEVIAELEGEGRGFAYGSMLMLDTRGRCLANILIRTLIWRPDAERGGQVTYRVGGGITHASNAALEEQESLTKGLALARSLGSETTFDEIL